MDAMQQMAANMLGKMTGLTPEQMQAMAQNAMSMMQSLDSRLANIESMISDLHNERFSERDNIDPEITMLEDASNG